MTLIPIEKFDEMAEYSSLDRVLLDKDGIMPKLMPTDASHYHIKPPTAMQYDGYCNNFWWVMQNVSLKV